MAIASTVKMAYIIYYAIFAVDAIAMEFPY